MELDGAPGSTTVGVMEGDGTPAACSNNQEGKGGTPTQDTGGKILLNGCPPRSYPAKGEGTTGAVTKPTGTSLSKNFQPTLVGFPRLSHFISGTALLRDFLTHFSN